MLGAIIGDIIGSVYEFDPVKTTHFPLFTKKSSYTDDTVLTVAVAYSLLYKKGYVASLKHFARRYTARGLGCYGKSANDKQVGSWTGYKSDGTTYTETYVAGVKQ